MTLLSACAVLATPGKAGSQPEAGGPLLPLGWDEEKITIRFWIIGILAALLGVTLFLATLDRLP